MCLQFVFVVFLVIEISAIVNCDPNEICSTFSGRRIYLEENGQGAIRAVNVSASNLKNVRYCFDENDLKRQSRRLFMCIE